jgi:hypothetical protein
MKNLIKNKWRQKKREPYATAEILRHDIHPEGLNVDRIRFLESGCLVPKAEAGHIISLFRGQGRLLLDGDTRRPFHLQAGVHLYLPPGSSVILEAEAETEFLRVSSPTALQARGKRILLRDEFFLSACASESQSLRWILTPQYLSRRIFLYHDQTLLSKSGYPVSWFHTTMFDVSGLPVNQDGESVFKMSYNSRTEFNVCYEVEGTARVRMARHPYHEKKQLWRKWLPLDGESTYHLNESADSPEVEPCFNEKTQTFQLYRNKHEVYIANGYVSLFCLFDPSPTGIERHKPGEYSDYEPLPQVIGSRSYEIHQRQIVKYDEMVNRLSLSKAAGEINSLYDTPIWRQYSWGRKVQSAIETTLAKTLAQEGQGREQILTRWIQPPSGEGTRASPSISL